MALTVHQSNRLEYLAKVLCSLVKIPPNHLFAQEEMIVGTQGMQRYINKKIAEDQSIAANIHYSKMPSFFWRLIRTCLPETPQFHVYSPDVLRWYLLDLLYSKAWHTDLLEPVRQVWQPYLAEYSTAAYHLSGKMAELFDQYLVYRPQWIAAWDKNQTLNLGEHELWQMRLWQHIRQDINAPHRVALWQDLQAYLQQKNLPVLNRLPERIFVFGFNAIAPMYLSLLDSLSQHVDVHLFLLNPAEDYWADALPSKVNILEYADLHRPLLNSLGQQGRYFFSSILELKPSLETMPYAQYDNSNAILHHLQFSIQSAEYQVQKLVDVAEDKSIVVHRTHSPLRELQVAKESVLAYLQENPQAKLEDVAILSPNIDEYVPFIDAIFGNAQGNLPALPYSIADTKTVHNNPFLNAWENLLRLFDSRFESDWVLALLDNHCVLTRFSLSVDEVALCRYWVKNLNIHWGKDQAMRTKYAPALAEDESFTWQQGIKRLLSGLLLPENNELWQGIAPFDTPLEAIDTATSFVAFLYALFDAYALWQSDEDATLSEWIERIWTISDTLLEGENQRIQFQQQIECWQESSAVVNAQTRFSSTLIAEHLKTILQQPTEQGFLRGGITFCSIMPMRSLPFAYLALLGMNDGTFPRISRHLPFDLMALYPQGGDRARREDDRYLFLEIILSARDVLHISFVGRNIQNNSLLEPSGLVHELMDACAKMVGCTPEVFWRHKCIDHPLHAFSYRYFLPSGNLKPSFRQDYAKASHSGYKKRKSFLEGWSKEKAPQQLHIEMADWLYFWRNPVRHWLQQTLQWQDSYLNEDVQYAEPFTLTDEEQIYSAYIQARQENHDFGLTAQKLLAENRYPAGEIGIHWQEDAMNKVLHLDSALFAKTRAPEMIQLNIDDMVFSGSLTLLTTDKQVFFLSKKPNSTQRLNAYLQHLIACAALPKEQICTHLVWPQDSEILNHFPAANALSVLSRSLYWYQQGMNKPLPFFARMAFSVGEKWLGNDKETAYQHALQELLNSSDKRKAQMDYREVKTVFAHQPELPIDHDDFWLLLEEIMLPLLSQCHAPFSDGENH